VACVDGGEGYASRLAEYLEGIGCTDVSVLEGGTPAWVAAGYTAFSGVNVPSKAFGEWIEHHYETPSVDPAELKAMMDGGTDMVVLDSRPIDEFRRMTIPTAVNVPGGELVYRIGEFVTRPETTIVVNCAGRTRSILGAESLRSAGVPNRIVALRNGTMGWELAGFTCDRGRSDRYPDRIPAGVDIALDRADSFARRNGVRFITRAEFDRMQGEAGRTTYLLDVRDPAEFAAGHLIGSRSAPGGQLVQATDQWVAVRGARIVLVDDTGVRARMTGGWLRQLGGWDVCVLTDGLDGRIETGAWAPTCPEAEVLRIPHVTPAELAILAAEGAVQVVDLARSIDFRDGHVPGALWGIRTRLAKLADRLTGDRQIIVTAPEEAQARLAAAELQGFAKAPVKILAGGTKAWATAGFPMAADRRDPADAECVDFYLRPYDRNEGIEEAMHAYLSWEIDLVHEVKKDGDAPFGAWA
jgi:rhodanese-related sulfurtransferase